MNTSLIDQPSEPGERPTDKPLWQLKRDLSHALAEAERLRDLIALVELWERYKRTEALR